MGRDTFQLSGAGGKMEMCVCVWGGGHAKEAAPQSSLRTSQHTSAIALAQIH